MSTTTAAAAPTIPTLAPNNSATYPCAFPPVDNQSPALKSTLPICYIPADGPGNSSWFEQCLGPDPNIFTEKCVLYGQITIDQSTWARENGSSWRGAYSCIASLAQQEPAGNRSSYGCRAQSFVKTPQPEGGADKLGMAKILTAVMSIGLIGAIMGGI